MATGQTEELSARGGEPCGHCSYVADRGRVVFYWRKATALYAAGIHSGYLCRKCADWREIKGGQ